jgi:hypothetical protein
MATVIYTIAGGVAPFTVELTPSLIPINTHLSIGTFSFTNVENGDYTLVITDSNECVYEYQLTVDPFVTTTTTTVIPGNNIIVGQIQDPILIFNPNSTNRSNHYFGDTLTDTNITLYLWFKTLDGKPLTSSKTINYSINAIGEILNTSTTGATIGSGYTDNFIDNSYLGVTLLTTGITGVSFNGLIKISSTEYEGISYAFTAMTITGTSGTVYVIPTQYTGLSYNANSKFTYLGVSDEIHTEVTELISGAATTIYGNIKFKKDFIETYFKYKYQKDLFLPDFQIDLNASTLWLSPNIPIVDGTKIYGVNYIDRDNVIMKF